MNRYEKIDTIGEGTYGIVLKCKHKETEEIVAIKRFKEKEEDLDETTRKVLLREVKVLKALKHENIIEMKEAFRRKGTLHLVFEFFGESLLEIIEAHPHGMEAGVIASVVCQAARALEYCHKGNIVHRDVKPENLLIDMKDNSVRLCDFGCARKLPEAGMELTDYVMTRWYRPPELLVSSTDYDTSVDLWALGCIAGEMTDSQPLFAGTSDIDQLACIQKVLGPITEQQKQRSMELSCMKGVDFSGASEPETLDTRYSGKMSAQQLQFMKGVLRMNPGDRLTARAVLKLPWLQSANLPASLREVKQKRQAEASKPKRPPSLQPSFDPKVESAEPRDGAAKLDGRRTKQGSEPLPRQPASSSTTPAGGGGLPDISPSNAGHPRLLPKRGNDSEIPSLGVPGKKTRAPSREQQGSRGLQSHRSATAVSETSALFSSGTQSLSDTKRSKPRGLPTGLLRTPSMSSEQAAPDPADTGAIPKGMSGGFSKWSPECQVAVPEGLLQQDSGPRVSEPELWQLGHRRRRERWSGA